MQVAPQLRVGGLKVWVLRGAGLVHLQSSPIRLRWKNILQLSWSLGLSRYAYFTITLYQGWWVTGGLVQSPLPLHPFSGQSPVNSSSIWRSTSLTTTSTTELLELPLDPEKTFVKGPDLPFALHKHCALQIAPGWAETINKSKTLSRRTLAWL